MWTDHSGAWGSPSCLLCVTQTQQKSAANCGQNRQHYPTQPGTGRGQPPLAWRFLIILHIVFKSLREMFCLRKCERS